MRHFPSDAKLMAIVGSQASWSTSAIDLEILDVAAGVPMATRGPAVALCRPIGERC